MNDQVTIPVCSTGFNDKKHEKLNKKQKTLIKFSSRANEKQNETTNKTRIL